MQTEQTLDWINLKLRAKEILIFLLNYFKNPVIGIRNIPEWDWWTIVVIQGSLSALCGMLSGFVAQSVSGVFLGLIFFPISSIACHFIISGFFYYTFLFFYQAEVQFRKLYVLTVLANLPFIVMIILSPLLKPIGLLGLVVTGILLLVGFVEHFRLPRRSLSRFLIALYCSYVVLWIFSSLSLTKKEDAFRKMATPESLDILEKEFKNK